MIRSTPNLRETKKYLEFILQISFRTAMES